MEKSVSIEFGALAKQIREQLKEQGITFKPKIAKRFQMIADAIILLHLHGIIPDSIRDSSREKLMKQISQEWMKDRSKKPTTIINEDSL